MCFSCCVCAAGEATKAKTRHKRHRLPFHIGNSQLQLQQPPAARSSNPPSSFRLISSLEVHASSSAQLRQQAWTTAVEVQESIQVWGCLGQSAFYIAAGVGGVQGGWVEQSSPCCQGVRFGKTDFPWQQAGAVLCLVPAGYANLSGPLPAADTALMRIWGGTKTLGT